MTRLLLAALLLLLSVCAYADEELTITSAPSAAIIQEQAYVSRDVAMLIPAVQTEFTPRADSFDLCTPLLAIQVSPIQTGPFRILTGASWRQLVIPLHRDESGAVPVDTPLDFTGAAFTVEFVPANPVTIPLSINARISHITYDGVTSVHWNYDAFYQGQPYTYPTNIAPLEPPPPCVFEWQVYLDSSGIEHSNWVSTGEPEGCITPLVWGDANNGYSIWTFSTVVSFEAMAAFIPIKATVTASPGVLDIRIPADQTIDMNRWTGILAVTIDGDTVFPLIIPIESYPSVTRI